MDRRQLQIGLAGALVSLTASTAIVVRGASSPGPAATATAFEAPGGGPVSFRGQLDRTAVLAGSDGIVRMELVMAAARGEAAVTAVRRPTDLVIVLDRSGSMDGDKMAQARASVRELVSKLGPQDRFALVTYADDAAISIPLAAADENARSVWTAAVGEIVPDGGTNMSRGLDLALDLVHRSRQAGRVPHAILISDGLANQGDASPEGLVARARRAAVGEYMLSAVGVGADFNEHLMTAIADAGSGNYYYLRDALELASVFARELDTARTTVASALAVRIEPAPGVRVVDAAGYPLEPAGDGVVFRPGSLFAGQERRVWVALAVPQQTAGEYDLGRFSLSYGAGDGRRSLSFADTPRIACVTSADDFYRLVDVPAWSRSVVVDTYNEMQAEVAREVKAGRRDEALRKLHAFKDETGRMNAHLQSPPVAAQLESADALEADVRAAFEGPRQEELRNDLSKASSAQAVDARRAGSKK